MAKAVRKKVTTSEESSGIKIGANPLPISFAQFSKNPVIGTMFLVIIGISALYVDIRTTFNKQIDGQGGKIEKLEGKVDLLQDAVRRCDSSLSSATTKLSTLNQLGKIENIK
jgi:hypothetical protein